MKNLGMILRVIAVGLCVVAFVLLFVPQEAKLRSEVWGSVGGIYSNTVEISSENTYIDYNYFESLERIKNEGFSAPLGVGVCIFLWLLVFVVLGAGAVKFLKKIKLSPIAKYMLWLAPLVVNIILIIFCLSTVKPLDKAYVIDGPNYIGSYQGYKIYSEVSIYFHYKLVAPIIMFFVSLGALIGAGVIEFLQGRNIQAEVVDSESGSIELGGNAPANEDAVTGETEATEATEAVE